MAKFKKQKHGHVNPIINQEEISLIAQVDRAESSTTNSQILGRNGEKGIISFLSRYLPNCFQTVGGHFVTPSGTLSPEIDVLILDARYPLLSKNEDGTVIAMSHSVIAAIEVKRSLNKTEILNIKKNGRQIAKLSDEIFNPKKMQGGIIQATLAYRSINRLDTIAKHFFSDYQEQPPTNDIHLLRVHDSEQCGDEGPLGAFIWLDGRTYPSSITTLAPLSDFYYRLVQDMYYNLSFRNADFHDIAGHMSGYIKWGTYPCLNRGQ